MPLRGSSTYYSDVSWFVRAVRAVPVIAGAALVGGLIGGFAVFAVDSALNWEPASRPEARADNQASAPTGGQTSTQPSARSSTEAITVEQRATRPVRAVGGAIPDPSAGMSGPPPAAQPQRTSAPAQPQTSSQPISSQLLAPTLLGPATRLQAPTASASGVTQTRNQPVSQTNQSSLSTQNTTPAQQQRWPDALSRAHQNGAQEQSASPPTPQSTGVNKNGEVDRKQSDSNGAATADSQDRPSSTRHGRHSKRQPVFSPNGGGYANDNATTPPTRRQDARTYDRDRLYDSYSNRRNRSYGSRREPGYGDVAPQPAPVPYGGGGYFGRGYYSDDY